MKTKKQVQKTVKTTTCRRLAYFCISVIIVLFITIVILSIQIKKMTLATFKVGDYVNATGNILYSGNLDYDRHGVMVLNVAFSKVVRDGKKVVVQEDVKDCRLFLKKNCHVSLAELSDDGKTVYFAGEITKINRAKDFLGIKISVYDCPED